jgi:hypothetical protein
MTAKKTEEVASGGIFSVFAHPDFDAFEGSQAIAVPQFDLNDYQAPAVAVIDLNAAAAEESHSSGQAAHSKEK